MALKSAAGKLKSLPGRLAAAFLPRKPRFNQLKDNADLSPEFQKELRRLPTEEMDNDIKELQRVNRNLGVAGLSLFIGVLVVENFVLKTIAEDFKQLRRARNESGAEEGSVKAGKQPKKGAANKSCAA